jgi:hypothetical protein
VVVIYLSSAMSAPSFPVFRKNYRRARAVRPPLRGFQSWGPGVGARGLSSLTPSLLRCIPIDERIIRGERGDTCLVARKYWLSWR